MTEGSMNWNGRTFGELTADEKRQVTREAARQLETELTAMAPAIAGWMETDYEPAPEPNEVKK